MRIKKPLFILLIVFILLNISDIVTTIFIFEAEANPIFNAIGNIYVMIAIKIFVTALICLLAFRDLYPSNMSFFMIISILVYACLALLIAQIVNIQGILNPDIIVQGASMPFAERTNYYFKIMSIIYVIPILITLLTFWIYDNSRKEESINKTLSEANGWKLWKIQR